MAYKSKRVEKVLHPILLVMQTMPQYAVLVPAMVLFGIGDHAAVIINNGCCYSTNDPINFVRT